MQLQIKNKSKTATSNVPTRKDFKWTLISICSIILTSHVQNSDTSPKERS